MSGIDFAFHIINLYRIYENDKWIYSLYKPINTDIDYEMYRYNIPARYKYIYYNNRTEKLFYRDVIEDEECDLNTDYILDDDIFNKESLLMYRDCKGNHIAKMFTGIDRDTITSSIIVGSNSRYTQKP